MFSKEINNKIYEKLDNTIIIFKKIKTYLSV